MSADAAGDTCWVRDPGDFDISDCVLGPFAELFEVVAAVSRKVTSVAETAAETGSGQLVAHSHSIVDVATGDGVQYLASVIMCFDTGYADTAGELVGTVLNLGPFPTLRAVNSAVSGQVAIGSYLMFERELLAFVGMSHSITSRTGAHGTMEFFVTAAMTYRSADLTSGLAAEPAAAPTAPPVAHPSAPSPRRRMRFRWGGDKARRSANYRPRGD